jgi:hypothetical protein
MWKICNLVCPSCLYLLIMLKFHFLFTCSFEKERHFKNNYTRIIFHILMAPPQFRFFLLVWTSSFLPWSSPQHFDTMHSWIYFMNLRYPCKLEIKDTTFMLYFLWINIDINDKMIIQLKSDLLLSNISLV